VNEDEATSLFNRAADSIPPIPRPAANQLVERGKRVQRRQRLISAGSVAAVAALIIGAGALWLPGSGGTAQPPSATNQTTAPEDFTLPTAPRGTRWVGFNDVMVAVPASWSVNHTRCGQPLSDTVEFDDSGAARACLIQSSPERSIVRPVALSSPLGSQWKPPPPFWESVKLEGVPASRSPNLCEERDPRLCAVLVVPSRDAAFFVGSPDIETLSAVLGTAQLIPEGYAAVPDVSGMFDDSDIAPRMSEAGLQWSPRCPSGVTCDMSAVTATKPRAGRVVPVGTTVSSVQRPSGDDDSTPDQDVEEPASGELQGEPPSQSQLLGTWQLQPGPRFSASGRPTGPLEVSIGHNFAPLGWGGFDGCNDQAGPFDWQADGSFSASIGISTDVACEDPVEDTGLTTGVSVILAASQVRVDGDRLNFYNDDDELLGTFARRTSSVEAYLEEETATVYSAVLQEFLKGFSDADDRPTVLVVAHTFKKVGWTTAGSSVPGDALPITVQQAITERLADTAILKWVQPSESVTHGDVDRCAVRMDGDLEVTLGTFEDHPDGGSVTVSAVTDAPCFEGSFMTFVLEQVEDEWTVTDITTPVGEN